MKPSNRGKRVPGRIVETDLKGYVKFQADDNSWPDYLTSNEANGANVGDVGYITYQSTASRGFWSFTKER